MIYNRIPWPPLESFLRHMDSYVRQLAKWGRFIIKGCPTCLRKVNPLIISFFGVLKLEGYGIHIVSLAASGLIENELWAWDGVRMC